MAKELGINKIYTIDEELKRKIKGVEIENPVPQDIMREYHQYIKEKIS